MTEGPLEVARISRGGLYYEMQARLGLVRDDDLHPVSRAIFFVLIAWVVPLALSSLEGKGFGSTTEATFLLSLPVLSRFFLGVGLLVIMEPVAEHQLAKVCRPLLSVPLLAPGSASAARSAVDVSVRRRNSRLAELVCLAVACGCALGAAFGLREFDENSWVFMTGSGGENFSYAALWCLWISSPIYFFLVARWVWRILIVALFLKRIAALELRLTVTHPDGAGGIGFMAGFPNAYALFVFAVSCNLGAGLAENLSAQTINTTSFTVVVVAWLLITNGLLALPVLFFKNPLEILKQKALEVAQAQATRNQLVEEKALAEESNCGATEDEIRQSPSLPDSSSIFHAAKNLSTVLIKRSSILPISAAAVLPVVAAGAMLLPVSGLTPILRKLLLF